MDGDYIGNIFGWRISLIGLVVLLAFLSVIAYRHYALDVPVGFELEESSDPKTETDSLEELNR